MKKLDEKLSLLRMAQAFGVEPDPGLLEEIQRLTKQQEQLQARVHAASQQLFETKPEPYKRPSTYPDGKHIPDALPDLYQPASNADVPKNQRCDNCEYYVADSKKCTLWKNAVVRPAYWCAKWEKIEAKPEPVREQTLVDQVVRNISESTVVGPEPALVPKPADPLIKKVEQLEKWISRIAATGPGGGEVNLRWLDDVDRSTITDDYYLRYEASTKKFMFDAGHKNNFYLAAQSNETQTSSATSATAMTFNVIDSNYGISITSNSIIVISNPGTYNLQFGAQFVNTGNTPDDVYIWLRQNGSNIPGSNGTLTVPAKDNNNSPGKVISSWNYVIVTTSISETVQLMWFAADETHVTMPFISSIAATATSPEIPGTASVILTVTPVKVDSH